MLESIVVYSFTALILYQLALPYLNPNCSRKFWTADMIWSVIVIAFIAGARYKVGVDYIGYLNSYNEILSGEELYRDDFEIGFLLISRLLAILDAHFFFFFALWASVQIGFVYSAMKDSRYIIPYLALCIMLGPYFLTWMNGIRQTVVACAFVWAVRFIKEQRLKPYLLFIALAYTIHHSALILLPFYLLGRKKEVSDTTAKNLIILFICIFLGSTPTWISSLSFLGPLLDTVGFDRYGGVFDAMNEGVTKLVRFDWGPTKIAALLLEILIIIYYPKMRKQFQQTKIDMFFLLFFIGICWYYLVMNTVHQMIRPTEYFTIFRLPMTAYLLYYLKKVIRREDIFLFACILCFSYIAITIYKGYINPVDSYSTVLYHFFFEKV